MTDVDDCEGYLWKLGQTSGLRGHSYKRRYFSLHAGAKEIK